MKTLGKMIDKKVLVEMTEIEHDILHKLQRASEGKSFGEYDHFGVREMNADLDGVFRLINVFVSMKFGINDFRNQLDALEKALVGDKK